jgi:hypothetical protein
MNSDRGDADGPVVPYTQKMENQTPPNHTYRFLQLLVFTPYYRPIATFAPIYSIDFNRIATCETLWYI